MADYENDTCFQIVLVMCITDCIIYVGLDKMLQKSFTCQFGPLPDTLQAGARIFPQVLRMYCIHRAGVPESHDAHAFCCLYD